MVRKKQIRARGKFSISQFFQKLKNGENVAVVVERTLATSFPKRIQGRVGVVKEKRGRSYVVEIKDGNKLKEFIIAPIHLKKIKRIEKSK
jgi:large subunit ribosomal protein L21e